MTDFSKMTDEEMFAHDENIFKNRVKIGDGTIVVLNNGMGDHIVFKHVLPLIKKPVVFTCYPDIIPGRSIAEAQAMFGDLKKYGIYEKMDEWKWTDSLENAFKKLYGVTNDR